MAPDTGIFEAGHPVTSSGTAATNMRLVHMPWTMNAAMNTSAPGAAAASIEGKNEKGHVDHEHPPRWTVPRELHCRDSPNGISGSRERENEIARRLGDAERLRDRGGERDHPGTRHQIGNERKDDECYGSGVAVGKRSTKARQGNLRFSLIGL